MHAGKLSLAFCLAGAALAGAAAGAAAAQETRTLDGSTFTKQRGGWLQRNPDGREYAVDSRVITLKFRAGTDRAAETALIAAKGDEALRRNSLGFIDVELKAGVDVFAAIDAYGASGLVESAAPNSQGEYTATPNDPTFAAQWHWPIIDADLAWDVVTGNPTVIVAVLDSGTEFTHDDIGPGTDGYQNVWLNPGEDAWSNPDNPATGNGVDNDGNGLVDDWKGWDFNNNNNNSAGTNFHGTAVAGLVVAKTNNLRQVAGAAGGWNGPGARVMIVGVGDAGPNGAIIDDSILYAVAKGAKVIQFSLTVGQTPAINAALDAAHAANLTVVCASGNDGSTTVGYPSSYGNVIAIGSTTITDTRSSFSNHGPRLDLSAPGSSVTTTNTGDGTTSSSGTSFAAPIVSGVVALMLSANPNLTNTEIRQILRDTADKVGGFNYNWNPATPGHSFELGYGRVNAAAAVAAANTALFEDGFESGDTTGWTAASP